jgi:hypothetical protein
MSKERRVELETYQARSGEGWCNNVDEFKRRGSVMEMSPSAQAETDEEGDDERAEVHFFEVVKYLLV